MAIKIGYDFINHKVITNDTKEVNEEEKRILSNFINLLSSYLDRNKLSIVANSNDYTTLQYTDYDVARLKYTDRSKWIKVPIANKCREANLNNPLFKDQIKKSEGFWKSTLQNEILKPYIGYIILYVEEMESFKNK